MPSTDLPLIVVLGPTGAGKSELGLELAQSLGGEIVNFDSVQAIRGLDIGSAKLPVAARRGVAHHLIDIVEPANELTAGEYARRARIVLADVSERGKLPVLVGGTGFYLRALLDGLSPAPGRDELLRQRLGKLAARRPAGLHRFLRLRDPEAARRIHSNDLQKLIRAIELTLTGGRPAIDMQRAPRQALDGYAVLKIGIRPDRNSLCERIDRRSAQMFANGLIDETKRLLDSGVPAESRSLLSLGYRQAVSVLTGGMPLDAAVRECQAKTRQYAKRQMTWFRTERDVHWLHGFGDQVSVQEAATELVREFLAGLL